MNKFAKFAMATMLVATSITAVGCSAKEETKPAATETADKAEDESKTFRAVFAATLIAESNMQSLFHTAKGLNADGTDYVFTEPTKSTEDAVAYLEKYWDKDLAKTEFESYLLTDAAKIEEINKALEAAAKAAEKEHTPITVAADDTKVGANDIASAKVKYEGAKISKDGDNYILEASGLKYTLAAEGNSFKIIAKEGKLAQ